MNKIVKRPLEQLGYGFVDPKYLRPGEDEYYQRERYRRKGKQYRKLTAKEIEILVKNENTADDWSSIYVTARFNPELVKGCQFHGMIRIGDLEDFYLEYHDLRVPVGLRNSMIVACDIGSNTAIDNVRYLGHYILGDEVILLNIDEMLCTDYAKFGNGIVKEGESEKVRIELEVCNENGGRSVLPFNGMLPGDAFLWAKYRDESELVERFRELTDAKYDNRRGYYGLVGDRSIVKDCRILKDVRIGSDAYIKGANKLKNLTINSSDKAGSQIGEGCELVNGIVGYGARIFYGVKAVRFITGTHCQVKYGARLINSYLGDNSTVSCCEVLNSLIFPGHEQHHNNSFLCAAMVLGQSNIAAGVTAGSNHNSRANDGEIVAGRGFWPGLCSSFKHSSRFASFSLLAKGSYPAELNITLPFALVSNDEKNGRLLVMPAYWFMYNVYALARNEWKYGVRDKRVVKEQRLEFDALAPDTVEEVFAALTLLEKWTGKALAKEDGENVEAIDEGTLIEKGRTFLQEHPEEADRLEVLGENMEKSLRPVHILKVGKAHGVYREMVHFYGVRSLLRLMQQKGIDSLEALLRSLGTPERATWVNVGGQMVRKEDLDILKRSIVDRSLDSWDSVHREYIRLGEKYPIDQARHALASLLEVNNISLEQLNLERWFDFLDRAVATKERIAKLTYESRKKDYDNLFRRMTFSSEEEMNAVNGPLEENDFVLQMRGEAEAFRAEVERLKTTEEARV